MTPAAALLVVALLPSQASSRHELERAIALQKEGKWEEAAAHYRKILEREPERVAARLYLAETLWLAGAPDDARQEIIRSRRSAPKLLLPLLLSVRVEGRENEELQSAIPNPALRARVLQNTMIPGEAFVPLERPALVLLSLGALELAVQDYGAAAEADPGNAELHRLMGIGLFKASRSREAASALEKAVALDPRDAASWGQLGSCYLRLMWWEPAIEAFERAAALEGEKPAGLLAIGYAYERKPDFEKALDFYRKAGELAPGWAQAPYRVGRTLIKMDRLGDAEKSFRHALELDPKMVEASCFLGAVLLEKGDLVSATQELEHAVVLGPRYPKARYYLGQAYLRAGRAEEARQALAEYERLTVQTGEVDPP